MPQAIHAAERPQYGRQATNKPEAGPGQGKHLSISQARAGGRKKGITPQGGPGSGIHSEPSIIYGD